jgi:hypothetical protein
MYVGLHYLRIIFKTGKQHNNTSLVCPLVHVCWIAFATINEFHRVDVLPPLPTAAHSANLDALSHVFVFLADSFIFVLHFSCIS